MSGTLNIRFAHDMPAAAVEVVAPDLASVDRVWLKPDQQASVDVPSEGSFLRVYLPSGQIVTLEDPGNLNRLISLADVMSRAGRRPDPTLKRRKRIGEIRRGASLESFRGPVALRPRVGLCTLEGGVQVQLVGAPAGPVQASVGDDNASVAFKPATMLGVYELMLDAPEMQVRVRLPGFLEEVAVRSDELDDDRRVVTVRVRTNNPAADTICGYMNRGDLHSAATLASTADKAQELLREKVEDPFGAAVGAYLLLRIRRYDLMHDWTANLANWYPQLADGAVIRAWHLIQVGAHDREKEIRDCFDRAIAASLPVFTEGLQLLSDGIRLLGDEAKSMADSLNKRAGVVLWSSPFTATVHGARGGASGAIDVDIGYGSQV